MTPSARSKKLDVLKRVAVELRYFGGLTLEEIAHMLRFPS